MKIINLEQRSDEWKEYRRKCITATDASIINETNIFQDNSPYTLWQKKMGFKNEEPLNEKMLEGTVLEPIALKWYNGMHNMNYHPVCGVNDSLNWAFASFDGYNEKSELILEIKCGEKAYNIAQQGKIPDYYLDQIQHLLFVSNKTSCIYLCFRPEKKPIEIIVPYDEEHITNLIIKEKEFYKYLLENNPPPFTQRELNQEHLFIEDYELEKREIKWKEISSIIKPLKKELEQLKKEMIELGDDGNFKGNYLKFTRNSASKIDYKAAALDNKIDLEPYTTEQIGFYRISPIKRIEE